MIYNDITQRYFETAPHAGTLSGSDVRRGVAGNREHGTQVRFDVQVREGRLAAVRFQAFGCPHTVAVCAYLATGAQGTVPRTELPEPLEALMRRFGLPAEKRGRLLVVEDAWRAAMTG